MRRIPEQPDDPEHQDGVSVEHDEQDFTDVDVIQRLVRDLDLSGGIARIFRQAPGSAEYDYEGEIAVDGFSLDTVKRSFGGGRYKVRMTDGRGKYAKTIRFSIAAHHRSDAEQHAQCTPMNNDSGNRELIAYLIKTSEDARQQAMQQQQQMMTLMVTMMTEGNKSLASMMGAVMGGNRQPSPEPASRLLEVMTPFLLQGGRQQSSPLSEIVEGIKVVKQLSSDEKSKDETQEEDVLDKLMRVGVPVLGAIMNRGGGAPQPRQPIAGPQQPEDPMKERVRSLAMQLRAVTPLLVRAARKNSDVVSYLDVLETALDDEGRAILVEFLRRDDWVAIMFNNDPGVTQNLGWFENLRAVILDPSILDEDQPGEANTKDDAPPQQGEPRVV